MSAAMLDALNSTLKIGNRNHYFFNFRNEEPKTIKGKLTGVRSPSL